MLAFGSPWEDRSMTLAVLPDGEPIIKLNRPQGGGALSLQSLKTDLPLEASCRGCFERGFLEREWQWRERIIHRRGGWRECPQTSCRGIKAPESRSVTNWGKLECR